MSSYLNLYNIETTFFIISLSFLCTAESSSDNVYFAANFKNTDSMSFDISYQQVNINSSGESVTTSRLYGWQEGDEFWLACEYLWNHKLYCIAGNFCLEKNFFAFFAPLILSHEWLKFLSCEFFVPC